MKESDAQDSNTIPSTLDSKNIRPQHDLMHTPVSRNTTESMEEAPIFEEGKKTSIDLDSCVRCVHTSLAIF